MELEKIRQNVGIMVLTLTKGLHQTINRHLELLEEAEHQVMRIRAEARVKEDKELERKAGELLEGIRRFKEAIREIESEVIRITGIQKARRIF